MFRGWGVVVGEYLGRIQSHLLHLTSYLDRYRFRLQQWSYSTLWRNPQSSLGLDQYSIHLERTKHIQTLHQKIYIFQSWRSTTSHPYFSKCMYQNKCYQLTWSRDVQCSPLTFNTERANATHRQGTLGGRAADLCMFWRGCFVCPSGISCAQCPVWDCWVRQRCLPFPRHSPWWLHLTARHWTVWSSWVTGSAAAE